MLWLYYASVLAGAADITVKNITKSNILHLVMFSFILEIERIILIYFLPIFPLYQ
jgi:hypothetical protein